MRPERTPVTVLGGYLGAGKTTVVNAILAGDHGRRLAVLVNDFGSVNIDADLIIDHNGNTISLQNGCICCSIADSLGDALDAVLAFEPPPDQILIEASGVAEPAKVSAYGQGWPGCRLDAVVVLADVESIQKLATDEFVGDVVQRQLSAADIVVVTKCDLVDPLRVGTVTDWVATNTGGRPVVFTSYQANIDPVLLLDPPQTDFVDPSHAVTVQPGSSGARFISHVETFSTPIRSETLADALATWPGAVVRVKGIVDVDESGAANIVHRVGRRWTIEPWNGPAAYTAPRRLMAIATAHPPNLDLAQLLQALTD